MFSWKQSFRNLVLPERMGSPFSYAAVILIISMSGCYPPIRDFEDVTSFDDHLIDSSIKNIYPNPSDPLSRYENLYEQRIREALLSRFPIGTNISEVVNYLSRTGSQCIQQPADGSEQIDCRYQKEWPYERYRMEGPFNLWRDEKIQEGHFIANVLIRVNSIDGKIHALKVIADRKTVTPK